MAANSTWKKTNTARGTPSWRKTDLPSGSGAMAWRQLTATSEGSAADDPSTILTTATFSGGLFRTVFGTSTTAFDGYKENCPGWSYPLLTLYPSFDPSRHILELAADWRAAGGGQFSLPGSNTGAGCFFGVSDRAWTDRAGMNASWAGMAVAGVANFGSRHFGQATASGNSLAGTTPVLMRSTIEFGLTSGNVYRPVQSIWTWDESGTPDFWVADTSSTLLATFGALANWRVVTGGFRLGTTAATGQDNRWRLFWRVALRQSTVPS